MAPADHRRAPRIAAAVALLFVLTDFASAVPTLCDTSLVAPKYFYFQPLDAFDMVIVTTTCTSRWNGNCTEARVPGYSLFEVGFPD
jgi:hypothetical protein